MSARQHIAAIVLLLGLSATALAVRPASLLKDFPAGTLIIESGQDRCLLIRSWFADQRERQSQGLMFVERLEPEEGMLFRYPQPALITMWMRNTYVPLDMLFIREDNVVARIAADTTPLSEVRISSGEPVTQVLELNAGFAARWGIEPGHRLLLVD